MQIIDVAHANIHSCTGCIHCGYEGPCVQKDDVSIQRKRMKSALLAVAWNNDTWTFEALESHYHTLVRYLNLTDQGMVLGKGCGTPSMTRHSKYPQMAHEFGRKL